MKIKIHSGGELPSREQVEKEINSCDIIVNEVGEECYLLFCDMTRLMELGEILEEAGAKALTRGPLSPYKIWVVFPAKADAFLALLQKYGYDYRRHAPPPQNPI